MIAILIGVCFGVLWGMALWYMLLVRRVMRHHNLDYDTAHDELMEWIDNA